MANPMVLQMLDKNDYTGGKLANLFKVNRSLAYAAIDGAGTRETRIAIARIVNQLPSTLWPKNSVESKVLDNFFYISSIQLGMSIVDLVKLNEEIKNVQI
jgi:hypothetical protein